MAELYCDICGRGPVRAQILVEGAKMLACGGCLHTGKILFRFHEDDENGTVADNGLPARVPTLGGKAEEEIVDDWGLVIRSARDRMKLPIAVVAERIKEKESYLDAIENGRLMPSIEVARKIEKELGVKLVEKGSPSIAPSASAAGGQARYVPPTLADMLSSKTKDKKK